MQLSEANSLSFEEFISTFDNVIELCPLVAAAVWPQRPFSDLQNFQQAIESFIDALPLEGAYHNCCVVKAKSIMYKCC